jgi:hypothetical protein
MKMNQHSNEFSEMFNRVEMYQAKFGATETCHQNNSNNKNPTGLT